MEVGKEGSWIEVRRGRERGEINRIFNAFFSFNVFCLIDVK